MKKAIILGLVGSLVAACEDERGPAGPGDDSLGQVFEVDLSFDYDSENRFWITGTGIPSDIVVYESDVVLAYRFVDELPNGDFVWEMLPNVYFLEGGTIQYVFNHTVADVELIIDGNFDLRDLHPDYTDDQLFRFVVAPAAFVTENKVDLTDYEAVVEALGITGEYRIPAR